ncbi:deoxyuridine 5'-triphosphate nucleotidohydrolase [Candidatus Micrarchaeota archaeon]|nr:deoxyuridine 5'-triphosphate nucleotidohydrolase [Candidatus Micrarchaeota archaeon]
MLLSKHEIKERIQKSGLVSNYVNLDEQLQPAGIDLTVSKVYKFKTSGKIDFDNKERKLSEVEELHPDSRGYFNLPKGIYKLQFAEEVRLPNDVAAINILRSSVMRSGCMMHHGFWDPGYHGKGETALLVENENGLQLKKGAKVSQLIFMKLSQETREGYSGIHHMENLK